MSILGPQARTSADRQADRAMLVRAIATLGRFTLIEAIHSRIAVAAVIVILVGAGFGRFTNMLALTDSSGIQAATLAALYRLAAVFLVCSFTIASVVREHNDKGLELIFSLPLPRAGYLLGQCLGCTLAAVVLAALFALPLGFSAPWPALAAWAVSLALELTLMASASLLCALTFTHVVGSLAATAAFYALARVIGALLAIGSGSVAPVESAAFQAASGILQVIATLLPRLDLFTRTAWLTGDAPPFADFGLIALQSLVYTALLLAAGFIDLMRKNV